MEGNGNDAVVVGGLQETKVSLENLVSQQRVLNVSCGADTHPLENMQGQTVGDVARLMSELLNITPEHRTVYVNGKRADFGQVLDGTESVEFVREAGQKGDQP